MNINTYVQSLNKKIIEIKKLKREDYLNAW